jgi:ribosome-associated translation inhibitor RaiA
MIKVIFKNLEKSEFALETAEERVGAVVDKFPDLRKSRISVTMEMENSPLQAGRDLFTVKIHISGGRYQGIRIQKSAPNLYAALADLVDHLLEKLNRFGDRSRVRNRNTARRIAAIQPEATAPGDSVPESFRSSEIKMKTLHSK